MKRTRTSEQRFCASGQTVQLVSDHQRVNVLSEAPDLFSDAFKAL